MPVICLEVILRFLPVSDSLLKLPVNSTNPYIRFKPNRDIVRSSGYNFSIASEKHINNYGFLNDNDYEPEDRSPLLAIIGDSYVEAAQVDNVETMHGILSNKTTTRGRVYSFGSSGSPLSNYLAYANYAMTEFNADALVFIIIGNDFDQSLTSYMNIPGGHYFLDGSNPLKLVRRDYQPALFRRVLRHSALARYVVLNLQLNWRSIENRFRNDGENAELEYVGNTRANFNAKRISDAQSAVDRFFELLPDLTGLANDKILFVVDGMRPQLYDPSTLKQANGSYFDRMRKYFATVASSWGYEVIDMQPIFLKRHSRDGTRFEYPTDGHWNEFGHALVAESISESAVFGSLFTQ